jgi:hypothetical protein
LKQKLTIAERVHLRIFQFVYWLLTKVPDDIGHNVRVWWTLATPAVVRCERCGDKFKQVFLGSRYYTQGSKCAAETFQWGDHWYLQCYYGSDFDQNVYRFVNEPAVELTNLRTICDTCINSLAERKLIELAATNVFYVETFKK